MPMPVNTKVSNPKKEEEIASGFLGGLNTFQDETLVKASELTEGKNIRLLVDGVEPRPGTEYYGDDGGETQILGGIGYYNSDGTREFLRVGNDGKLKKYVSDTPTQIGSAVWDTASRINFVQARDYIFMFNGTDELSYYDGTTINTYTALTTPANLAVGNQGSAGTTTYSYRISAFGKGETLACTAVATTTGNATLNATNYNSLTWDATANAEGYNVWGREATGLAETYLDTVYTNSYNDKGQSTPSTTIIPPEANTTEGIVCSMGIFALSRVFAAGDPDNPSRLYYGGVGTNIDNFSGSTEGGGWVDVFRNDGAIIRAIKPFQGGVIVWKDNAIYKFSFTTVTYSDTTAELPQLEEITRSFGGISFRGTLAVENDIIFPAKKDGRLAFYSLGNQENYAGSVLRTNELSIKIQEKLENVKVSYLPNAAGFYFNNIYGCAIATSSSSTNNRIWCLDTRFGAWVYWDDLKPAFFMTYTDTNLDEKLYYGTENDGYMIEMFKSDRNDNDSAISVSFATKSFNQKIFHKYKNYYNPTFQFKDVNRSGALTGEIYVDGSILQGGFTINQQTGGGGGPGGSMPGFTLPGDSDFATETTTGISSDIIVESHKKTTGRSIKYVFNSSTADLYYKFLSLAHTYQILPGKRLLSSQRYYVTG